MKQTRRRFLATLALGPSALADAAAAAERKLESSSPLGSDFLVRRDELELNFSQGPPARRMAFAKHRGDPAQWRQACRRKLAELAGITPPGPAQVNELRQDTFLGVRFRALVMRVQPGLSIPAYLLQPQDHTTKRIVLAIHGHGEVEAVIGVHDDYHHRFGLELARAGFTVLCPALRGFGVLRDLAWGTGGQRCLDYWDWSRGAQFTLVTDAFVHGRTLIGQTVEDLLRWEQWLVQTYQLDTIDVAGISYGGDLAILYPVFSTRVGKIFASGTLGSFVPVFSRCYNAPAHCIPGILEWMDRSDIAGLNAPRPLALHYGALDVPGPKNNSASYNESVLPALRELRDIYRAFGAESAVKLIVTPNRGHEMDLDALLNFLA